MSKFIIFIIFLVFGFKINIFSQVSSFIDNVVFDFSDGTKLHLFASVFDSTKHSIKYCKILDWSGVCLIDEKPVFGTDWDIPKITLDRAYLEINNKKIELEVTGMYNPWFREPQKKFFSVIKWAKSGFIIRGYFSDGAGGYVAEWQIIAGVSIRTILSNDDDIVMRFFQNKQNQ